MTKGNNQTWKRNGPTVQLHVYFFSLKLCEFWGVMECLDGCYVRDLKGLARLEIDISWMLYLYFL